MVLPAVPGFQNGYCSGFQHEHTVRFIALMEEILAVGDRDRFRSIQKEPEHLPAYTTENRHTLQRFDAFFSAVTPYQPFRDNYKVFGTI